MPRQLIVEPSAALPIRDRVAVITPMFSSLVPRFATSTKRTGTRYSPMICRPGIVANASCATVTPPSTEFSMAIIAASLAPVMTSFKASPMFATGAHSCPCASGTWRSAASVKVPAGPKKL